MPARTERANRFQALVENAPGVLIELSTDGQVRYLNHAFAPFTVDQIAGRSWFDLVPPEEAHKHREALASVVQTGETAVFEARGVAPEGSSEVPWYLTQIAALRDEHGQIDGALLWATDQTHRITDHERFFHSLEASPVGMLLVDSQGRMVLANGAIERIFGRSRADLLGQPVELLIPRGHAAEHRAMREEYAANMGSRQMAGRIVAAERGDGARLALEVGLSPLELSDGKYVLCSVTDCTDHQRLEEQFRQAQKMEAIGRLAGGIAHDFNNMLTAIIAFNDFALDALPAEHPAREDLAEVKRAAQRATTLARQLLAFSRKQTLRPEVCGLNSVVSEIERMLQRVLGEDIELVTSLADGLWQVEVDRGAMEQVLMNMAVNARDAMPKGGVLSLETRNVETVEKMSAYGALTMPAGRYVLLTISDNGVGMDEGTREHLFEPFFTTKGTSGTGLGLATCYGIIAQAGGFIWPYSEPGKGTTFKIYLPRARADSAHPSVMTVSPAPGRGNERILIVEDEPIVRALAARTLEGQGYVVTTAEDTQVAQALCRDPAHAFDALLTDVVMPGINGGDLATIAKSCRPGLRVLFMSGFTPSAMVRSGLVSGDADLIEKPFAPEALARTMRALLDR